MACDRLIVLLAAIAAVLAVSAAQDASYENHVVIRAVPQSEDDVAVVHAFLLGHPDLDVWAETKIPGQPVDIRVSQKDRKFVEDFFSGLGIDFEISIDNVQMLIAQQAEQRSERRRGNMRLDWSDYYPLEEINSWMEAVALNNPQTVKSIQAGISTEGRTIQGLAISFKEGNPIVFVEAGIHAREWITPATATYFIKEVLSSEDETIRSFDWHIFPSVNPDGYVYTHTTDRLWRKTRSRHYYVFHGVDANRNFPFHWNEAGASSMPFAETYAGPSAASEPETQGLMKYLDSVANRTTAYMCLHSYSQLLMFPWSYTKQLAPTNGDMMAVAQAGAKYMEREFGTKFTVGPIATTIYEAAGSSVDYAYSKGIKYPFAFELRDKGRYGFLLPKEQIIPTASETYGAVLEMIKEITRREQ